MGFLSLFVGRNPQKKTYVWIHIWSISSSPNTEDEDAEKSRVAGEKRKKLAMTCCSANIGTRNLDSSRTTAITGSCRALRCFFNNKVFLTPSVHGNARHHHITGVPPSVLLLVHSIWYICSAQSWHRPTLFCCSKNTGVDGIVAAPAARIAMASR